MEMILGMALEPPLYARRLVRPVIVQDDVDFHARPLGELGIDLVEELEELVLPMSSITLADHMARGDVQRSEQRGRSVADIVVGPPLGLTRGHGQQGLGTVQCLHLALLIDRQDDRVRRRTHVQADDITDLFDKEGIGGEFERLAEVGLQAEGAPDPGDRSLRQADGFGHAARAPVRRGLGPLLQSLGDDLLDDRVGDCTRGTRSRFVGQPLEAVGEEPLPPLADRDDVDAKPGSSGLVIKPLGAGQDDLGAGGKALGTLGTTGPDLELLPLVIAQGKRGFRATALAYHVSHLINYIIIQRAVQGYLANF
jgi:hypothetical protein